MQIKDITYAIGVEIEKYTLVPNTIDLPQSDYEINQIFNVKIQEKDLNNVSGNIWTFLADAQITKTDPASKVRLTSPCKIVGNAIIEASSNGIPTVRKVTITKIN